MRICTVTARGKYGAEISDTLRAESLFDAADQFIDRWARLSEWNPGVVITVRCGGKEWRVRPDSPQLWNWRCRRHGWPSKD